MGLEPAGLLASATAAGSGEDEVAVGPQVAAEAQDDGGQVGHLVGGTDERRVGSAAREQEPSAAARVVEPGGGRDQMPQRVRLGDRGTVGHLEASPAFEGFDDGGTTDGEGSSAAIQSHDVDPGVRAGRAEGVLVGGLDRDDVEGCQESLGHVEPWRLEEDGRARRKQRFSRRSPRLFDVLGLDDGAEGFEVEGRGARERLPLDAVVDDNGAVAEAQGLADGAGRDAALH